MRDFALWATVLLSLVAGIRTHEEVEECAPKELSSTSRVTVAAKTRGLDLYTSKGIPEILQHVFADVRLNINLTDQKLYQLYQGPNCTSVENDYLTENRFFGLMKSVQMWRSLQLNPFQRVVVGIDTAEAYQIGLIVNYVSMWRLGLFLSGFILFFTAPWLVRNAVVYYAGGCTSGAVFSALILLFIFYRFIPKKTIGVPILIGGWGAAAWMATQAWNNLSFLLIEYQKYIAAYFLTAVAISFAYCYKQGPPKDDRTLDVLSWFLQGISFLLIYCSMQLDYISYAVIALLVVFSLLTSDPLFTVYDYIGSFWRSWFPKPRKMLTQEEYEREGAECTERELRKLRDYCRSPDANHWSITRSVRSPQKLARFVEGDTDHVSRREEHQYMDYMMDGERLYEPAERHDTTDSEVEREEEEERREKEERRRQRKSIVIPATPSTGRSSVRPAPHSIQSPATSSTSSSASSSHYQSTHSTTTAKSGKSAAASRPASSTTVTSRKGATARHPPPAKHHNNEYFSSDEDN